MGYGGVERVSQNIIGDRPGVGSICHDSIIEKSLRVQSRSFRGRFFLFCGGEYFELNPAGRQMFLEIDGKKTVYDISCAVSKGREVSLSRVLQETVDFFDCLKSMGVVDVVSDRWRG